jgi:Type II CAAX prenyl endopeptidase Rce1-like
VDLSTAEAVTAPRHFWALRAGTRRNHHGRSDRRQVGSEGPAQPGCPLAGGRALVCDRARTADGLSLAAAGLYYLFDGSRPVQIGAVSVLDFIVFVLVVGEELGWRGYALPLLLEKRSALMASLILGVLWGLWHLPTFLVPGTPQYGLPLPAFMLLTIEYSILMTWVYLHTKGSVLIATLFHGAINLSQGLFLGGIDGATRYWLLSIVYGAAALVVAIFALRSKSLQAPARDSEMPIQANDV